ncbi:SAM-dependent methyltransferase [Kitasatospora sp. NPDC059646]|uniref:SAM-dependent methyltransferase n=1 Tax=Kitasatospora sp. NPDC059646 TaxID=3346893 RepID=UPI0036C344DA
MSGARSDNSVPPYVDPTKPSIARVYDAFLGGTDNYEVDREVVRRVRTVAPDAPDLAVENRRFLIRACRYLAEQAGVTQYLDCGSGLPTAENTHNVVQRANPGATVVYVDNDPLVVAHSRALLERTENAVIVSADIFRPEQLLSNAVVRSALDWDRPIALLQLGTLHHWNGEAVRTRRDIMRAYVDALPSGSYVAISHFLDPEDEHSAVARAMEEMFLHSMMGSGTFSTASRIGEMFNDLELVEPGLVRCVDWRPDSPPGRRPTTAQRCIAGGVARKR